MTQISRKQLVVDPRLQWTLVLRVCGYWAACLFFVIAPISLYRTWLHPESLVFHHLANTIAEYSAILLCSALLLPLAIYDMLQLSNRVAGPAFRLRRELTRLAGGEYLEPVTLRPGDFLQDVADELNRVSSRLEEQKEPSQGLSRQIDSLIETQITAETADCQ